MCFNEQLAIKSAQAEALAKIKYDWIKRLDSKIQDVFFIEEMELMDLELMVASYGDPSVAIIGSVLDFGLRFPKEIRREATRKRHADKSIQIMLNRFLMLANGFDIPTVMIMNHPKLHDKWALSKLKEGKPLELTVPVEADQKLAKVLAEMMIKTDVLTHQVKFFERKQAKKALLQHDCG